MKKRIIYGLIISVALAFCLALAPSAIAASDEEEALQVMSTWIKAYNNSDYELIKSLYWNSPKTSAFTPGKEGAFLAQGYTAIAKSLESLSEVPAGTNSLSSHHAQAVMLGDNVAVLTQYFIGVGTDAETQEQSIGLIRQTFVVQKIGGKWLIVHDHGSNFPTE